MGSGVRAISINFHGLPSLKGDSGSDGVSIEQDYTTRTSLLTIKNQPDGLIVTGVFVDGLPQWTVPGATPATVFIRPPLMRQGERIEVRCVIPSDAPRGPAKGSEWLVPAYPPPTPTYGLTAPELPRTKTYP